MYVRFEHPPKDDKGNQKMVFLTGKGLLRARAIIGPVNPFLSECEIRNFGIWENSSGKYTLTLPSGTANFAILGAKGIVSKVTTVLDDGTEQVEQTTVPSKGGEKQITALTDMIMEVWNKNPAIRLEPGRRFELPLAPAEELPVAAKTTQPPQQKK